MNWKRFARISLPVLFALLIISGIVCHSRISDARTPTVRNGVLDLTEWNGQEAFEIDGEWEFYWDKQLTKREIEQGWYLPLIVEAPDKWSNHEINGVGLPGKGTATYLVHVTGAQAGTRYGIRIQEMAAVYRLYIDDALVARNGSFGDDESAPASDYRPQLTEFISSSESFDLILQIANDAYSTGGMREPIVFGTYKQVSDFDRLLSNIGAFAMSALTVTCMFFLIFFSAQHGERDMLILLGMGVLVLLRFLMIGDVALTLIFPEMSISTMVRINFLTSFWAQFLLLYFVYYVYANLVRKWQVSALFAYSIASTVFTLLFPLQIVTSAYILMNGVLLLVIIVITTQLTRASWQGREGAPLLLGAIWLIMVLIFYELFVPDHSTGYYLLTNLHFDYMIFVFAQVAVVAQRYRRAQELEVAHLKGQIRPHFIHNSLTSIISISRTDPDRSRELLVDFSSYLRGFYDYDRDELVTFKEELELVRAYVSLEQARFGEKLRIEYRIEAEDFLLPSLILQPLVENSFVHGLREKDGGGTVIVYARKVKNGKIRVGVRDDGVGIFVKSAPARRGVGIENINRRLSRLYRTSLVYLVPEEGGCEVYLEIPYQEEMKNEGMAY